jgi:uncharacterized membrane protein
MDYNVFEQDYYAAEWFAVEVPSGHPFYTDSTGQYVLYSYGMQGISWNNNHRLIWANTTLIEENAYAYLGYSNTRGDVLYSATNLDNYMNGTARVSQLATWSNLIYSNGGAYILAGVSPG